VGGRPLIIEPQGWCDNPQWHRGWKRLCSMSIKGGCNHFELIRFPNDSGLVIVALKVMSISLSPKLTNRVIRGYHKISDPTAIRSNNLDRKIDVMGGVDVLGDIVTRALHPDFPENIRFSVFTIHVAF